MCLNVQSGNFQSTLNQAAVGFVKTIQPDYVHNIILTKKKGISQLSILKIYEMKARCNVPALILLLSLLARINLENNTFSLG